MWVAGSSPTRRTARGYLEVDIIPDDPAAIVKPICIAVKQLERPSPPAPMRCAERYAQAEHAVPVLGSAKNVVFGGDMCWRDGTDRSFPLPARWFDAWPTWMVLRATPTKGVNFIPYIKLLGVE
jgi:tyrosyl-DNA phosphodiesterase 2